jgi:hypothetical protein
VAGPSEYLVERLRKHIASRMQSNTTQVWKALPHEQYLKLCGQQQELEKLLEAVNDSYRRVNASEDLDEEASLTQSLKRLGEEIPE